MDATLKLVASSPSAVTFIFPVTDRTGAGNTADARVAFILKRVVGEVVVTDIVPDLFTAPGSHRIDFHRLGCRVIFNDLYIFSSRRLMATDAGDPRFFIGQIVL